MTSERPEIFDQEIFDARVQLIYDIGDRLPEGREEKLQAAERICNELEELKAQLDRLIESGLEKIKIVMLPTILAASAARATRTFFTAFGRPPSPNVPEGTPKQFKTKTFSDDMFQAGQDITATKILEIRELVKTVRAEQV